MRFIKVSKEDIEKLGSYYQSLMSDAYEVIFYTGGKAIGEEIVEMISPEEDILENGAKLIEARGWVDEISLEKEVARAQGSIEVNTDRDSPSCHILRGILSGIYEEAIGKIIDVTEVKCENLGDEHCEFKIEEKNFEG